MTLFLTEICKRVILGQKDVYNPIYLYGDPEKVSRAMDIISTGWGMLHGEEASYRTSGDDFFTDMVQAIKKGGDEAESFIASIPKRGLLIIEGFEGIAGKEATMRVFYGIFDALYEHGGQILIGSIFPPSLLYSLDDRVYTQISSGIVYCVDEEDFSAPFEDLETAGLKILQKRGDNKEPQKHKPPRDEPPMQEDPHPLTLEEFKALSIEDKIEEYCKFIVPILQQNGIPNEAIDWKLSDLADRGAPEMRLQRVMELFHYIDTHDDKIDNDIFRELTIELLNKYPWK